MATCLTISRAEYICRLIDDCVAYIDCFDFTDDETKEYQIKLQKVLSKYKKKRVSMCLILPDWLYLGGVNNAENVTKLKEAKINYVINMDSGFINVQYPKSMNMNALNIDAEDIDTYDITQHFEQCFNFMDECYKNGGKMLLHCYAGMNRSVAICIAYLLQSNHDIQEINAAEKKLLDIVEYIKHKRGQILTNIGFQKQLIQYAKSIKKL